MKLEKRQRREWIQRLAPLIGLLLVGVGVWGEFGLWVALIIVVVLILADALASALVERREHAARKSARARNPRENA